MTQPCNDARIIGVAKVYFEDGNAIQVTHISNKTVLASYRLTTSCVKVECCHCCIADLTLKWRKRRRGGYLSHAVNRWVTRRRCERHRLVIHIC